MQTTRLSSLSPAADFEVSCPSWQLVFFAKNLAYFPVFERTDHGFAEKIFVGLSCPKSIALWVSSGHDRKESLYNG